MPVSNTAARNSYTGNGVTTSFTYAFRILDQTHIAVYLNGVLQASGFSVTGVGANVGGTVVFTVAPANGVAVTLVRNVPFDQLVDTVNNETILENVFDTAVDKLTMIAQQLRDLIGRSPTLGQGDVNGAGAYLANNNRITGLGTPTGTTDAVPKSYVDAIQVAAGNVVSPGAGAVGFVLRATSATAWAWQSLSTFLAAEFATVYGTTRGLFIRGAAAYQTLAHGAAGTVLTSNGPSADPTWNTPSAATGGGTDQIFFLNGQTVTTDYTVPATSNAHSAGPITINNGITVTVLNGAVWAVI